MRRGGTGRRCVFFFPPASWGGGRLIDSILHRRLSTLVWASFFSLNDTWQKKNKKICDLSPCLCLALSQDIKGKTLTAAGTPDLFSGRLPPHPSIFFPSTSHSIHPSSPLSIPPSSILSPWVHTYHLEQITPDCFLVFRPFYDLKTVGGL